MARRNRFTVYDMLDEKGIFEQNGANTCSPKYVGPVEYPKMLYHPKGETRVTQKAEIVVTPIGPIQVGEQRELINRVAQDAEEEAQLVAEGWHLHPAKAIAASGKPEPATGAPGRIGALEDEIERLKVELARLTPKTQVTKAA